MRWRAGIVGVTIGVIVVVGVGSYLARAHALACHRPRTAGVRAASITPDPQAARLSCGPAALVVLAKAWDVQAAARLPALFERDRAATRAVTSFYDLAAWGREAGLDLVGLKVEPQRVARLPLPAIVQVRPGHFLVLDTAGSERVVLIDQGNVTRDLSRGEFERQFTGFALCLRS